MNATDFAKLRTELLTVAQDISDKKRPAYTLGDQDVLVNFKKVGERIGLSARQAAGVYLLKQIDSITSYLKDPTIPQAEPIESRFADAINYLLLAYGIITEEESADTRSGFVRRSEGCPIIKYDPKRFETPIFNAQRVAWAREKDTGHYFYFNELLKMWVGAKRTWEGK